MVLLVRGEVVHADRLLAHPAVAPASEAFLAQPRDLPAIQGQLVYVCQGEEATVAADEAALLCSSDATTCVMVAIVAMPPEAAAVAIARMVHHDDGTVHSQAALQHTIAGLGPQGARLWLAGGYADARGVGQHVYTSLLTFLEQCPVPFDVQLCCVGDHNTAADGSPRCTALAVDPHTLTARPAEPPPDARGPLLPARQAQWAYHVPGSSNNSSSSDVGDSGRLHSIYCTASRQLRLRLWHGRPPPHILWHVAQMLALGDEQLLQHWSTSPAHEPPHFVQDVRASFCWLLEQRGTASSVLHSFAWTGSEAGWEAVDAAKAAAPVAEAADGAALPLGGATQPE